MNNCFWHFLFLHFWGVFCWWCPCSQWLPSAVLKCCLVFLSVRRLWGALWRTMYLVSFVQAWVKVLLAVSSVLINAQYINIMRKVSWNRNTHKTKLLVSWPKKCCDRGLQAPNPVSLGSDASVFTYRMCNHCQNKSTISTWFGKLRLLSNFP